MKEAATKSQLWNVNGVAVDVSIAAVVSLISVAWLKDRSGQLDAH